MSRVSSLNSQYEFFFKKIFPNIALAPYISAYRLFGGNRIGGGNVCSSKLPLPRAVACLACVFASPLLLPLTLMTALIAVAIAVIGLLLGVVAYPVAAIRDGCCDRTTCSL